VRLAKAFESLTVAYRLGRQRPPATALDTISELGFLIDE